MLQVLMSSQTESTLPARLGRVCAGSYELCVELLKLVRAVGERNDFCAQVLKLAQLCATQELYVASKRCQATCPTPY